MPSKSEPHNSSESLESKNSIMGKTEIHNVVIKEEGMNGCPDERSVDEEDEEDNDKYSEDSSYPIDLPLEVITTIEPFNYAYPYLKNMSNGVLTHRNIFTEQEREVLRKIVDKYREIVDTRSRTREIYMEKQSVWQQIVEEYNSTDNILMRTEKELKKCWDNMKYRARLAEKEQQKAETQNVQKSPDPHQIACNAVQAALEKMLSIQSQTGNSEGDANVNMIPVFDNETKENWSSVSGLSLNDNDSRLSTNEDIERDDKETDDGEDEQPVLKKARQESPKLSSILLGDATKNSISKSNNSFPRNHYNIPNCTKVTHIKKRLKKNNGSNTVNILPKGLNSCVSIMNIPNPNQSVNSVSNFGSSGVDFSINEGDLHSSGVINLGSGITISPQKFDKNASSPEGSNSSQVKPMPFLKKMFPNRCSKKGSKSARINQMFYYPNNSTKESLSDIENDKELLEEKLLLQRLEFGCQEHALRMKVLEKQLQAYSNESQFWAIKMSMLRNNHKEKHGTMVNGDL